MDHSGYDNWQAAHNYELYMGRWSLHMADLFLAWLARPAGLNWLDLGCGTGALAARILQVCDPHSVLCVDPAQDFLAHARVKMQDSRVSFAIAAAQALPCTDSCIDIACSGLAYNFFPDRLAALQEQKRVLVPGGLLAMYVWDYPAGGLGFIEAFWQAAREVSPDAAMLDESRRFAFCNPATLLGELSQVGLQGASFELLEMVTHFADFEDFWQPFTLGSGPAPGFLASLSELQRVELYDLLRKRHDNGKPLSFPARAWAVQARNVHA